MRPKVKLKLKSFHHVVDDQDRIVMAEGRMLLLEAIAETGSINRAAKKMGMSYKTAWSKLRTTQEHLKVNVVATDKAKGTRLTKVGRELLCTYKKMKRQCLSADDNIFDAHFYPVDTQFISIRSKLPPIISFVGHSGSGKTTFIEKIIPLLTKGGIKIGTIKHDVHGFEMDKPGKDTWRHKKAGAVFTIISSFRQIGMVMDTDHDHMPHELAALSSNAGIDLIVAEGFKKGPQAKIEVFRPEATGDEEPLCQNDPQLMAVVTDSDVSVDLPVFGLNDIESVVVFIGHCFHLPLTL